MDCVKSERILKYLQGEGGDLTVQEDCNDLLS